MSEMKWKIYYDNNTTFSNLDGEWESAPSDGVVCVIVKSDKIGRKIFQGSDFYFKIPGTDTLAYADDLGPFLRKLGLIKFGRWTSDNAMEKGLIEAQNDKDIPPKSAKDPFYDDPTQRIPPSIQQR
ncbi:MAG: hypothetical protein IH948_04650 [Bacteroidetes bacterium]|nr:hypothetical protein [Bacteroidota bacterium]